MSECCLYLDTHLGQPLEGDVGGAGPHVRRGRWRRRRLAAEAGGVAGRVHTLRGVRRLRTDKGMVLLGRKRGFGKAGSGFGFV